MKLDHHLFFPLIATTVATIVVSCSTTPIPPSQQAYVGTWVTEDGSYVKIDADGGGQTKTNSKTIDGGSATVAEDQLIISFGPIKQTFEITQPPQQQNGRWTMGLDNIVFVKNDSLSADNSSITSNPDNQPVDNPSTTSEPNGSFSAAVEELIQTSFAEQTGVEPSSVTCPENIPLQANYSFSCQIETAQGETIKANVIQENDQGSIVWNAENLVVLTALETNIEQSIKSQIDVNTNVDCGGKIKVTQPQEEFNCSVTAEDGSTGVVLVTVKDSEGNVDWKIVN